jgi:hypothetical protein
MEVLNLSNKTDRTRRAVGKALKDIEHGLSEQDVKSIKRANQRSSRRAREPATNNIGDWMGKNDDHVAIKGELPYLTINQMCWYSKGDKKYHYHPRLNQNLKAMPNDVQRQFRGLLIERLVRRNVLHHQFKFIEGTLRAFEKKYY